MLTLNTGTRKSLRRFGTHIAPSTVDSRYNHHDRTQVVARAYNLSITTISCSLVHVIEWRGLPFRSQFGKTKKSRQIIRRLPEGTHNINLRRHPSTAPINRVATMHPKDRKQPWRMMMLFVSRIIFAMILSPKSIW